MLQCSVSLYYFGFVINNNGEFIPLWYNETMNKTLPVVAALLLTILGNVAAAAEKPKYLPKDREEDLTLLNKRNSPKIEKILMTLKTFGISDPAIAEFATTVDTRTSGGYFLIHEEKMLGGSLKLRYALKPSIGTKQLELRFTPEESHMEYIMRKNSVMAVYSYSF